MQQYEQIIYSLEHRLCISYDLNKIVVIATLIIDTLFVLHHVYKPTPSGLLASDREKYYGRIMSNLTVK